MLDIFYMSVGNVPTVDGDDEDVAIYNEVVHRLPGCRRVNELNIDTR